MPNGTIETSEVWKRFRNDQRPSYLQDQVARMGARLRGQASGPSWRWVLKDINMHAAPGESWGLVGANGAGKSTLLKCLSRVMYPTAGKVSAFGRVGALIEVRAGISPLLTGRENIFLTGSIMGLKRRDVAKRFDEIVEFANLESAVDRQVKYYSSGMQMRLGFGVAAFLSPDILLVDEVLAVGDAAFQQRCLDRIRHVLSEGTTLVFVSHDLAAVEATCANGLWVHNGNIESRGPIRDVLAAYRAAVEGQASEGRPRLSGLVNVTEASATSPDGIPKTGEQLDIELTLDTPLEYRSWIYIGVTQGAATPIFLINPGREVLLEPGSTNVRCEISRLPLPAGTYYVWVAVHHQWTDGSELVGWQPATKFDVYGPPLDAAPRGIVRLSPVHVDSSWDIQSAP